ncbi:hypothetical protein HY642_03025, partial [Candidatus Woesearchaeota archaeon]|nr:hypothetical protein [Candidatus Woesearchaeota archaeon]
MTQLKYPLLALFALTITACGLVSPGIPAEAKIHQGTKGLEMEFMEGLPPKEVYT